MGVLVQFWNGTCRGLYTFCRGMYISNSPSHSAHHRYTTRPLWVFYAAIRHYRSLVESIHYLIRFGTGLLWAITGPFFTSFFVVSTSFVVRFCKVHFSFFQVLFTFTHAPSYHLIFTFLLVFLRFYKFIFIFLFFHFFHVAQPYPRSFTFLKVFFRLYKRFLAVSTIFLHFRNFFYRFFSNFYSHLPHLTIVFLRSSRFFLFLQEFFTFISAPPPQKKVF